MGTTGQSADRCGGRVVDGGCRGEPARRLVILVKAADEATGRPRWPERMSCWPLAAPRRLRSCSAPSRWRRPALRPPTPIWPSFRSRGVMPRRRRASRWSTGCTCCSSPTTCRWKRRLRSSSLRLSAACSAWGRMPGLHHQRHSAGVRQCRAARRRGAGGRVGHRPARGDMRAGAARDGSVASHRRRRPRPERGGRRADDGGRAAGAPGRPGDQRYRADLQAACVGRGRPGPGAGQSGS